MDDRITEINERLSTLEQEKIRLLAEMEKLRTVNSPPPLLGVPVASFAPVTPAEKVELFVSLFRCREDVYPRFWTNPTKGKSGYSPVCKNEWRSGVCRKPRIKCSECPNKAFVRFDASVVRGHLEGKEIVGTYAIRGDDTCVFLAADFDKTSWQEDILAYKQAGVELGVEASIERSRSGNGAHAWIFFSQPIPARSARQLGTIIMARAASQRHAIGLDSHDRFFPNQDYLPRGGFGNLIALPLQRSARSRGNTVFVDDGMVPYPNQWEYLSSRRRLSLDEVSHILDTTVGEKGPCEFGAPWAEDISFAERAVDASVREIPPDYFAGRIQMELSGQLAINIQGLPSRLIAAFKRTATFANPKYFELQRLRFSTWKTPRYIVCGELVANRLILPRGTLEACLKLCRDAGAPVDLVDRRGAPKGIRTRFRGELVKAQKRAAAEMLKYEDGVLVAPPGSGKTVIACSIIGKRKTSTLILVHRKALLDQWKSQLIKFLTIDPVKIGILAGNSKRMGGVIDVAMIQTLSGLEEGGRSLPSYGQVIVDECQHIPAFTFESAVKIIPARYWLGLTATPYRKDGQQAIIHMQCGPIRHEIATVPGPELNKRVVIRDTAFMLPPEAGPHPLINEVWEYMASDSGRIDLIAQDVEELLRSGRFPLILSERTKHLQNLAAEIRSRAGSRPIREFYFDSKMGKKARKKAIEGIKEALSAEEKPYILSTGSLIGEGFDLPELDTLVLAMPISFRGRLVQYAGRLHRSASSKKDVLILDYLDKSSGLTVSMFRKRLSTYKKMGYRIEPAAAGHQTYNAAQGELFRNTD